MRITSAAQLRFGGRGIEVLIQGNVKEHEWPTATVAHTGYIDMRTGQGIRDALNVEKEKSCLGRMGLDGARRKLSVLDFVFGIATQSALYRFPTRKRDGARGWLVITLRTGEPPVQIIRSRNRDFGAIGGDQAHFQFTQLDWFVAFIGDNQTDRKEVVLAIMHGENVGFTRRIERIDSDDYTFVFVLLICGISSCGMYLRCHKLLSRKGQGGQC